MEFPPYILESALIYVTSIDSKKEKKVFKKYDLNELNQLRYALNHTTAVALDAEWEPGSSTAALLQLACRGIKATVSGSEKKYEVEIGKQTDCVVFLVDLVDMDISTIWEVLNEMFVSAKILKLGFMFKNDLACLFNAFSHFESCKAGFEKVEPYIEIARLYDKLQFDQSGGKLQKNQKSLKAICEELLGLSISKVFQTSHWSFRPLTDAQKAYAAVDVECLVKLYDFFQEKFHKEGLVGFRDKLLRTASQERSNTQLPLGSVSEEKKVKSCVEYQGPPPWDLSLEGDGRPKFLCHTNVEGLTKYLRLLGFDAVVPSSKKANAARQIIDQVKKEKRILLTRDSNVCNEGDLNKNAAYLVKSDHKYKIDQLLEICAYHAMVTCCFGGDIQNPRTTEEDIEAAKRIKHIPGFLNDRRVLFTHCRKCKNVRMHVEYKDEFGKLVD